MPHIPMIPTNPTLIQRLSPAPTAPDRARSPAIDRVHDNHQIGPVVDQKLRTDDLVACPGHERAMFVGIDIDCIADLIDQLECRQKGDALGTGTPDDRTLALCMGYRSLCRQ